LPDFRFEYDGAAAGEHITALGERRHPRRDGFIGHCCFVRGGKSLDSFGGLFDQMARVSSVKAAITRSVVGSSMPSS
jgi:hypothetical protein